MPDTPEPPEPKPTPSPQKQTEKKKDEPRPVAGPPAKTSERKPLDLRVRTVRHENDASGAH